MEKIPDYRIREEDEEETQESLRTLRERMREHRLNKAELYRQQASLAAMAETEQQAGAEGGINLSQTSHDRAHTETVPHSQEAERESRTESRQTAVSPAPPTYQFCEPCPQSMRHVRIGELSSVDINWKMLTLARPTSKIDEDIFSK